MTDAPDPFVPADLDLRDFRWMKLDIIALFNSDFNATPDDTAWRAGVTLWGKAWHQVPAGSLPDDDGKLCNLAGLGRDLKTWRRVREQALHGFVRCSDGRMYHRFLCQMATEAAAERDRFSKRRAADRERKSAGRSAGIPPEKPEIPAEIPMENLLEGQGEGEGQGDKEESKRESPPPQTEKPPRARRAPAAVGYAFEGRVIRLTEPDLDRWRSSFRAIPDIAAELRTIDDKLFDEGFEGKWFGRVSGWLRSRHEALLAQQRKPHGGLLPNEGVFQ